MKTELEKQFKKQFATQLASKNRLKAFDTKPVGEGESSFKMTLNKIASVAQNSIR